MRSNTFPRLTPPSSSTSSPLDTPLIHSFSGLRGRRRDHRPAAMKNALSLLLLISLACHSHTLKCHTCVASNDDDCNRQGSTPCPQYADACSTITGPSTVMKSCTYKAFCDKAHGVSSGAKMDCCFGDDCNGPHRSHHRNSAGAVASSPVLLVTALLLRVATSQL